MNKTHDAHEHEHGIYSGDSAHARRGYAATPGVRRVALILTTLAAAVAGLAGGVHWRDDILRRLGRSGTGSTVPDRTAPTEQVTATDSGQPGQLWTCGMHPQVIQDKPGDCPICHMKLTPLNATLDEPSAGSERKIKYWWDPMMSPPYISDKPGKSPMGMDLIPVYEDEVSAGPVVTIDPVVVQNMGVRVANVATGALTREIRAVGFLDEAQPNIHDINLRVSGWVEQLYADTEGMYVEKGAPLFELYSPDVLVGLKEYALAKQSFEALPETADRFALRAANELHKAARLKLELWGIRPEEYRRLAAMEPLPSTVTFYSPVSGHVTEKAIVQGAAVKAGDRVLRIVDHSTLWLDAQVYEQHLPFIRLGQKVSATVEGLPDEGIEGEVIFIHPHVDAMTRAATVRMAVPNPDLTLRPGMYATAHVSATLASEVTLVPREAVIDTGARQVAFVALGGGRFEPRQLKTGPADDAGQVQVLAGLVPGETVVTSGQFLLDAESRMKEAIQKYLAQKLLAGQSTHGAEHPFAATDVSDSAASAVATPEADDVYREYLRIVKVLGAVQQDESPLNVGALVGAAQRLVNAASEERRDLSGKVLQSASGLKDRPRAEQRERFKALSDALIAMSNTYWPSSQVGPKLYVMYCPMVDASWLQSDEKLANPYYATEMKQCGEIRRTVSTILRNP